MRIAPSLLAADFLHLDREMEMLSRHADLVHLDVMDGTFVPNISFGFSVIDAVSKVTRKPLDAHLMVVHPERWFERLQKDGVSMLSFHLEAAGEGSADCLSRICSLGMQAGLAINPDVPVEALFPYIGQADFFLIMSVFAGFGGQSFIPESLDRIRSLRAELRRRGDVRTLIEVDGGVGLQNGPALAEAGADILVAGSAVFASPSPESVINALRGV